MSELDELLDSLREDRGGAVPQHKTDGLNARQRWMRKRTIGGYDNSYIRRRIEAKFDLHHPVPLRHWRWLRAGEVSEMLFDDAGDAVKGFRDRVGRVLSTIAREYPQVEKKYANGASRYLLPPLAD